MSNNRIFTIGHSNHPLDYFLSLLRKYQIQVIVDVRSSPYSKYVKHYNKELFQQSLIGQGYKYLFFGDILGGRPDSDKYYDENGYVLYGLLAKRKEFQEGIYRLLKGMSKYRIAIMCGEEKPHDCHRRLLVGRVLLDNDVELLHIRGDGSVQLETEIEPYVVQENFLNTRIETEWKSSQSVLQKKALLNSSRASKEQG